MFSSWNLHPQLVTDTWGNSMEVSGALLLSWGSAWTGPQQARGAQAHPLGDAEGQTFTVSNRILHRFHRFNITIIVNLYVNLQFESSTNSQVWWFDGLILSYHIPSFLPVISHQLDPALGPLGDPKRQCWSSTKVTPRQERTESSKKKASLASRSARRPRLHRDLQHLREECQWEISRILKWRYCTIFLAIFWGYISLHRPYIGLIYGRYLHFRILKFPLRIPIGMEFWCLPSFSGAFFSMQQTTGYCM